MRPLARFTRSSSRAAEWHACPTPYASVAVGSVILRQRSSAFCQAVGNGEPFEHGCCYVAPMAAVLAVAQARHPHRLEARHTNMDALRAHLATPRETPR